ncbi:MAG: ABC-2 type transport system ATP-binding protein [Nitriliruptoraceae bacterium]
MDVVPDIAIRVRGLVKRYGSVTAVDGLDLDVARGETLAILGPNGAGKSTTIECCEGYRRPDAGSVQVLGLDPHRDGDQLRPRIGVMLQEGGIYPVAYAPEVLHLYSRLFADPLDPIALLDQVGLAAAQKTRYRDLSGGQKQRLSLAVALIGKPEVVFLDEPTAGLDPAGRRETWEIVRGLQAEGVTIVLTTHLLDEAEELADRVAIVDRGRVVATGTPDELTHGTQADLTFSADAGLDVAGLGHTLGAAVVEEKPGRYRVDAEPTPAMVGDLGVWLAGQQAQLGELRAGKRSLEDVFLRLTSEPSAAAETRTASRRRRGRGRGRNTEVDA